MHESKNGGLKPHSYVNAGVTAVSATATVAGVLISAGVIVTAPVWGTALTVGGAALGIGYGIASVAGFDSTIDNWFKD